MRWNLHLELKVSRGRKMVFSLNDWWPFSKIREHHERLFIQCFRKQAFDNQQHAINTVWMKRWRGGGEPSAYLCPCCAKWHLTRLSPPEEHFKLGKSKKRLLRKLESRGDYGNARAAS